MKSLGKVSSKQDLENLIYNHALEFVEVFRSNPFTATFVRYNPTSRSGKFHQYVSVEIPLAVFNEWRAKQEASKPKYLRVKVNGAEGDVERSKYVAAKTKQLREFGYPSLTEKEVDEQIDAVKAKKTFGEGLTVIGMFMTEEIL